MSTTKSKVKPNSLKNLKRIPTEFEEQLSTKPLSTRVTQDTYEYVCNKENKSVWLRQLIEEAVRREKKQIN